MNEIDETFLAYKAIHDRGGLHFKPAPMGSLDEWGQTILQVHFHLLASHPKWFRADERVSDTYLLKLEDNVIGFVIVFPGTREYLWCEPNFTGSVHPGDASAHFISMSLGFPVRHVYNEKTGESVLVCDTPRGPIMVKKLESK